MSTHSRLQKLRKRCSECDALIFVPNVNLYYLTGLKLRQSERLLLYGICSSARTFLIAPFFEVARIKSSISISQVFSYKDEEGPIPAIKKVWEKYRIKKIGVEFTYMRLWELELLKQTIPGLKLSDISSILRELRIKKDFDEIEKLRASARIADHAMTMAKATIRSGISESDIGHAILEALRKGDAEGGAAVASGLRTALPHATTTNKIINPGDIVWVDIVVYYNSYVSDITRTFFISTPNPDLLAIYKVVINAQRRARTRTKPGMTAAAVDALCRNYINKYGYKDYFIHRTGHGIGLEVHEAPYIVKNNLIKLESGMAFTIEPGIYLPGKGGIRIEDSVVVTNKGIECLTKFPRSIIII